MLKHISLAALLISPLTLAGTVITPVQIYDGDSYKVDIEGWPPIIGKNMNIRLKGADAPSFNAKCQKERELAGKASAFAWNLLTSAKTVKIVDVEKDQYFRLIARIETDGKDLGTTMIDAGLAKPYGGGAIRSWCDAPEKPTKATGIPT